MRSLLCIVTSSLDEDTFTHQWRQRDRYTILDWHTTPYSVSYCVSCTPEEWIFRLSIEIVAFISRRWNNSRLCFIEWTMKTETKVRTQSRGRRPDSPDGRELTGLVEGSYPYRYTTMGDARMCCTGGDAAPRCGSGRRGALKGYVDGSTKGVSEQLPAGEKVGRSAGKWQW